MNYGFKLIISNKDKKLPEIDYGAWWNNINVYEAVRDSKIRKWEALGFKVDSIFEYIN